MRIESKNAIKPFWSWNDKLCADELTNQMDDMKNNGIDGFFMHARAGLQTEYMGEDWFKMIEACLNRADETDMGAWVYDENGWPSGFADGKVPAMGEDYQQKWLNFCFVGDKNFPEKRVIACYKKTDKGFEISETIENGCLVIYYDKNEYYIDTFNIESISAFIKATHEEYYKRFPERFGKSLKGFFTDEPQYCNNGHIPWSQVFEGEFLKEYGYSVIEKLPLLFFEKEGYESFRFDFYNLVSKLFRESFIKQMYDWCTEHNCKLTGHMMCEDSLTVQMRCTAGVMSCYEYFHEPGIDWLGRKIDSPILPKQLSSVAKQFGRKTLTETFALCGWDVSLNELRWIAQWQYVNGVTSLCPHLVGYSLRGIRKRDYPASLFTQLPWFEDAYSHFSKYFTKLGALLDSGTETAPLLVIHPMNSAYIAYNPDNIAAVDKMDGEFSNVSSSLNDYHIPYHYGDETIMSHYAEIDGKILRIGKCEYTSVLLPSLITLSSFVVKLLLKFIENGGKVYTYGDAPKFENGKITQDIICLESKTCKINDIEDLHLLIDTPLALSVTENNEQAKMVHSLQCKTTDGEQIIYLTNLSKEKRNVTLEINGEYSIYEIDLINDTEAQLPSEVSEGKTTSNLLFDEYAAHIIRCDKALNLAVKEEKEEKIKLNPRFDICGITPNALTLDSCEYRVDGGDWQPQIAVIKLQNKLIELKKPCDIELKFKFNIKEAFDFSSLELCVETPEIFTFEINGRVMNFVDNGYYIDKSFRKVRIGDYVQAGNNEIVMKCKFYQNENVYRVLFTPSIHETEKNKLTFDTELESIYIIGDFSVTTDDSYSLGEKRTVFAGHNFYISAPVKQVDINNITPQGFWFFAGKMKLNQTVCVDILKNHKYIISLSKLYAPAAKLAVNGKEVGIFAFTPLKLDVTEFLTNGENVIEITLLSGNRNLLGPHHKPYGESYFVAPSTFTDAPGWADNPNEPQWTDNFSFVLFGAEI